MLGLAADGYAADATTDLWARYLKDLQAGDGRWPVQAQRPPIESSDFQTTATTLRDTLYQSLSAIIAGVALTDPSFAKVALELSKEGAAKLGIA